jgi:hypothetical protein
MKKSILVELAQEALAGGDAPSEVRGKYHIAVIAQFLSMAYTDILQKEYDREDSEPSLFDNCAKRYELVVERNQRIDRNYVKLPVSLIPLRPRQAALRAISLLKSQQLAFAPIQNTSAPIWAELDAPKIDPTCTYMIEQNQIVFENNAPEIGSTLLIKIIPSLAELDDKDDVIVPGGNNMLLFQQMYQIMSMRRNRGDLNIDDNNATQILQ